MEIRGIFYQVLKQVFPHIGEIVGEGLAEYFQGIDGEGWYEAGPYQAVVQYLRDRISPQVMVLIGNHLVEAIREQTRHSDVNSPRELAGKLPELYSNFVRGEGAGNWRVEEFTPGRAIFEETGVTDNVDFSVGVIKSGLEAVGAYNVRIAVIDDRAKGADANRYLVEWLEPDVAA